jgi:hypothetical protein
MTKLGFHNVLLARIGHRGLIHPPHTFEEGKFKWAAAPIKKTFREGAAT